MPTVPELARNGRQNATTDAGILCRGARVERLSQTRSARAIYLPFYAERDYIYRATRRRDPRISGDHAKRSQTHYLKSVPPAAALKVKRAPGSVPRSGPEVRASSGRSSRRGGRDRIPGSSPAPPSAASVLRALQRKPAQGQGHAPCAPLLPAPHLSPRTTVRARPRRELSVRVFRVVPSLAARVAPATRKAAPPSCMATHVGIITSYIAFRQLLNSSIRG